MIKLSGRFFISFFIYVKLTCLNILFIFNFKKIIRPLYKGLNDLWTPENLVRYLFIQLLWLIVIGFGFRYLTPLFFFFPRLICWLLPCLQKAAKKFMKEERIESNGNGRVSQISC